MKRNKDILVAYNKIYELSLTLNKDDMNKENKENITFTKKIKVLIKNHEEAKSKLTLDLNSVYDCFLEEDRKK